MTMQPIRLLAATVVEDLSKNIDTNLIRYTGGDFLDLEKESGWAIETALATWDPAIATNLDPTGTPTAEISNSLLIYKGLQGMTPALAREERLWTRLCHVECLEYARKRWIGKEESAASAVRLHFFAAGLRGCRDQNAIGRLWWNGHLAALAMPDDIEGGLKLLLTRANYRLQIVDRADSAFRQPLVSGIFRLLEAESWFDVQDDNIAYFMFEVNKRSGGILFEAFDPAVVDAHLRALIPYAKQRKEDKLLIAAPA
uniref:DUF6339 family protein n=1 Tax=uncultured Sphingomonas sp. TaxID=158754 RepID=UPI0035CC190A